MKKLLCLGLSLYSLSSFAGLSKCEQKMQDLMLASEKINYPDTAQPELSKFSFKENGLDVSGVGMGRKARVLQAESWGTKGTGASLEEERG